MNRFPWEGVTHSLFSCTQDYINRWITTDYTDYLNITRITSFSERVRAITKGLHAIT